MTSVLTADAIAYIWMESLGGRRQPSPNSINTGWRDDAFRGYADHMQTPIFKNALAELEKLATHQATVLMCAETDWVKCHRSLISDALKAKGWDVWHITPSSVQPHLYTRVARVEGGQLSYSEERFL